MVRCIECPHLRKAKGEYYHYCQITKDGYSHPPDCRSMNQYQVWAVWGRKLENKPTVTKEA